MHKITFLTKQLNDDITYETDKKVYARINNIIENNEYIKTLIIKYNKHIFPIHTQDILFPLSHAKSHQPQLHQTQSQLSKSHQPQLHQTQSQLSKSHQTQSHHTQSSSLNLTSNKDIGRFCFIMNEHFDLSSNDFKKKSKKKNPLDLPNHFPKISSTIKIKMIGRMRTITELTEYETTMFSYLNLPEDQKDIVWSSSVNDAFILCGYQSALNDYNSKVDMKSKPLGIQSGFTLVLVVDKEQNKDGTFLTESTIHIDSTTNKYEEKTCKADLNCKAKHIFPPTAAYEFTTPASCTNITNSTDKTACYASLPSVTFTEIVLLTKYFNMDCYLLKHDSYNLYFFCIKDSMKTAVETYNKNPESKHHQLSKVNVTVLPKGNPIKIKYLKYKNKYLQLKKSILENTY